VLFLIRQSIRKSPMSRIRRGASTTEFNLKVLRSNCLSLQRSEMFIATKEARTDLAPVGAKPETKSEAHCQSRSAPAERRSTEKEH
jgi:hypothetical protein